MAAGRHCEILEYKSWFRTVISALSLGHNNPGLGTGDEICQFALACSNKIQHIVLDHAL